MTARQQALKDIKDELRKKNRTFIGFRTELNPIMDSLVKEQIDAQKKITTKKSYCMSVWTIKRK